MMKYKNKGYMIEVSLPEECGYEGYSVECLYRYNKAKEKYALSMWLRRYDMDNRFKIESQEIDTQYITGTKDTIVENICKIVEHASLSGYFDYYVERFEYTSKCFDIGNSIMEQKEKETRNVV